jgi:hypothetical protein
MDDRRIDEAVKRLRIITEMTEPRVDTGRFEYVFYAIAHAQMPFS